MIFRTLDELRSVVCVGGELTMLSHTRLGVPVIDLVTAAVSLRARICTSRLCTRVV